MSAREREELNLLGGRDISLEPLTLKTQEGILKGAISL